MRSLEALRLCALLLGSVACVTERTYAPEGAGTALAVQTEPEAAWRVVRSTGEVAGYVVRFGTPTGLGAHYFSVRNLDQQELGTLDELGRAWRYQPHAREAALLGAGTACDGAARILGLSDVRLESLELSELRALGRPSSRPGTR